MLLVIFVDLPNLPKSVLNPGTKSKLFPLILAVKLECLSHMKNAFTMKWSSLIAKQTVKVWIKALKSLVDLVSISSTFYVQVFCTKMLWAAFL